MPIKRLIIYDNRGQIKARQRQKMAFMFLHLIFLQLFSLVFMEKEMSYWQKSVCIIKFHHKWGQKIVSHHCHYDALKNRFNILPFCAIKCFSGEEIGFLGFSRIIHEILTLKLNGSFKICPLKLTKNSHKIDQFLAKNYPKMDQIWLKF